MTEADKPADTKDLMREALERKKNAQHATAEAKLKENKLSGGPHGAASGKRVFRRKSGG